MSLEVVRWPGWVVGQHGFLQKRIIFSMVGLTHKHVHVMNK